MPVKLLLNTLAKERLRKIKQRGSKMLFSLKVKVLWDCQNQKKRLNQIKSRNILNSSNSKLQNLINLNLNFQQKLSRLQRINKNKSQQESLNLAFKM
jgi:hypothetical protein